MSRRSRRVLTVDFDRDYIVLLIGSVVMHCSVHNRPYLVLKSTPVHFDCSMMMFCVCLDAARDDATLNNVAILGNGTKANLSMAVGSIDVDCYSTYVVERIVQHHNALLSYILRG